MSRFRIKFQTGDRVLTEGVIDKAARYAFTNRYCVELALAIHERTGWPIISTHAGNDGHQACSHPKATCSTSSAFTTARRG